MLCPHCGMRLPDNSEDCPVCRRSFSKKEKTVSFAKEQSADRNGIKDYLFLAVFLLAVPVFAFIAAFCDLPFFFCYFLLRLFVMFQSAVYAIMGFADKNFGRMRYVCSFFYIILAIKFCPILDGMKKSEWQKWDLAAAIMLFSGSLTFLIEFYKNKDAK